MLLRLFPFVVLSWVLVFKKNLPQISTLDTILVPGHLTSAGGWCNSRRILYAALAIGAVLAITGTLLVGSGNSSGANGWC